MKITPIAYDIHLMPDMERFTCPGKVWFSFKAENATALTLDILDMEIHECALSHEQSYFPVKFTVDDKGHGLTLMFEQELNGPQQISISYTAQINNLMAGCYRSRYFHEGKECYMASTQFEENDARRAFPCLDHPSQKAVFGISMDVDSCLTGIANTHVKEEIDLGNGKKRLIFEPTPQMSTYLVFFGWGDLEIQVDEQDKRVRTVTLPRMGKNADLSRDFGRKALKYCEDYYAYPYSIDKMDLIAVPDFAFGAMENWGAITFRENLLYYYPGKTSKTGVERICEVIAHEIVHQWFGNLVTPVDWKYLWLNESFATYFGYACTAFYHPEWAYWDKFLTDETSIAMERDSLRETTGIEIPSEGQVIIINSSTAPIIYNKGGALMLMLKDYIGEEAYQKALRAYLTKFAYQCTETVDLLKVFESETGMPLESFLTAWITSKGFPQVKAEVIGNKLHLSQKRFTYLPHNTDTLWPVPVSLELAYADGTRESRTIMLQTREADLELEKELKACWLNLGRMGFYRCLYTRENFLALGQLAAGGEMSHADRWGLVGDLWAAVKAGQMDFATFEQVCGEMQNEDHALALSGLASAIIEAFIVLDHHRQHISHFALPIFENALDKIGLEPKADEANTIAAVRERLLWGALFMGSAKITGFLQDKFRMLQQGDPIHADIVKSVMQGAAFTLGDEAYQWLRERFHTTEVEHERMNILLALGCVSDHKIAAELLEFVITEVPSRNQYIPVAAMGQNPFAKDYLWPWFRDNLGRIEKFHPMLYERVVAGVITYAQSANVAEMTQFFQNYITQKDLARDIIKLSLEKLEIYEGLRKRV